MLAPLLFKNIFGSYGNKEGNNSIHSMLDFLLCMAVTSEYCALPMNYIYQKLYVISSSIFTSLTITDTIE